MDITGLKEVKCLSCGKHLILAADVVQAYAIGWRTMDRGEPDLIIYKWIDRNGHFGYGSENPIRIENEIKNTVTDPTAVEHDGFVSKCESD